jgi:antitoxin (DNA-binding transcriptional repressor) of toxin-antitoxin stability system
MYDTRFVPATSVAEFQRVLAVAPGACLIGSMTDVTSKMLHEKTGQLLDRAGQGGRFRVLRQGRAEAFLIPAAETIHPEWPEIMAAVWNAQKKPGAKRSNPVVKERKARKYAAHLRCPLGPLRVLSSKRPILGGADGRCAAEPLAFIRFTWFKRRNIS